MTHDAGRFCNGTGWIRHPGDAAGANTAATSRCGRHYRWSLVLGFVLFPAPVFALLISISFGSVPGSVPLSGAGSNSASLDFGNISAFQPLKTGVSRASAASSYTVSSRFGVRATHLLGLASPSYTLQARLLSAQPLT